MNQHEKMHNATTALRKEIHIAIERLDLIRTEIGYLDSGRYSEGRVLGLKERVADLHARLEGLEEFVTQCQIQTERPKGEDEEIDVWI